MGDLNRIAQDAPDIGFRCCLDLSLGHAPILHNPGESWLRAFMVARR
jgi:hypothetical protein